MRKTLLLFAALAALFVAAGGTSAQGRFGEQKLLVIRATWGPVPYSEAEVRDVVFGETDAYVRASSYGQAWLSGKVTPWLRAFPTPITCSATIDQQAPRTAATAAGYNLGAYDRVVIVTPRPTGCQTAGLEAGDLWLFGYLERRVLAHELGHGFGLNHAYSWDCRRGPCRSIEYGDPYDEMGHGDGEYNAYEKFVIGWITERDVVRAGRAADVTIGPLEGVASSPRALVVTDATNEYWFEHREPLVADAHLAGDAATRGLIVHVTTPQDDPSAAVNSYPNPNTILLDPAKRGRAALLAGDVLRVPGSFEVSVLAHEGRAVRARFRWTDNARPATPRVSRPRGRIRPSGRIAVTWRAGAEKGSGLARYEIRLDGKLRATTTPLVLSDGAPVTVAAPRLGRHVVSVVAIDRAGNRSRPGTSHFSVLKGR